MILINVLILIFPKTPLQVPIPAMHIIRFWGYTRVRSLMVNNTVVADNKIC